MKIAIITDQHFGARNDSLFFSKHFKKFYENVFFPYVLKNDIKVVFDLGDTFDRRKYINFNILKETKQMWFDKLKEYNINLHAFVGNHTTYFKNTSEVNSLDLIINNYDNIVVYASPEVVEFDDTPILLMPWINNNNYDESMKALAKSKADILMGHLEVNGFMMNVNTIVATDGWDKKLFKRFDVVFSGHFHHKSDDGQIFYLGAPYEIYWTDFNDPRGFHIFDTATRELEYIVNPHTIYKKIYYDDTKNDYTKHDVSQYKEHYVKLIVVNKKDLYRFDMFVDRLLMADAFDVKIIEDFSELDATNVSDDIVENTEDTMTLLEKYINELDVTLDKNRLKNTMKALYNEAQDLEI